MTYQPPVVPGHTTQPPLADWTPPPAKKRGLLLWLIGATTVAFFAAGALVFTLTGGGDKTPAKTTPPSAAAAPSTFQIYGTLTLASGQFVTINDGDSCQGQDGFDDLAFGAAVTVTDANGAVIGVSQLSEVTSNGGMQGTCDLGFTVLNIPAGKGFYGVEVSHRSAVKYDEATLKSGPIALTVG